VAVFPDRIVLKNSSDDRATIEAAIQTGGSDAITQGELVLGIDTTDVRMYTKAGDGSIISIGQINSNPVLISDSAPTVDVDGNPLTDGDMWWDNATGALYTFYTGAWVEMVSGAAASPYVDPLTTNGDMLIHELGVTTRLGIGAANQVLTVDNFSRPRWSDPQAVPTSLGDLSDVDMTTTPPIAGQTITFDGSNWIPGAAPSGGGGGGSGAGIYLTEAQTAVNGAATFTGLGYSGILQKVHSTMDAWIVLYSSAAERTADAGRAFSEDPTPGSGVLFEAYVTAGGEVMATPGTTYMNNDIALTEAVYAAVRTQGGANVAATVTFSAYGLAAITAVNGGTFGSGV